MHDNRDNVERERGKMALPVHVYAIGARAGAHARSRAPWTASKSRNKAGTA